MNIDGKFQVYEGDKLISKGTNLITQKGRNILLNWLLHDSKRDNSQPIIYNGTSFSSQRFLTTNTSDLSSSEITVSNSNVATFWDNTTATDITTGTITIDINSRSIKLAGLYLYWSSNNFNSDWNYQYIQRMQIYTSEQTSAYAEENSKWTFRKIAMSCRIDSTVSKSKMIRFDSAYTTDGYIDNVKSIKIKLYSYNNNQSSRLYGVGVLQKTPYPNVPCVIGLGTGNTQPTISDLSLTQPRKFFVNNQYATIDCLNGSSSNINLNAALKDELLQKNIQQVNVVYVSRLNYAQCNGIEFKQIGLFYSNNQVDLSNGPNTCSQMFSHGLFDTPWFKTNQQIIDIKYTISISV